MYNNIGLRTARGSGTSGYVTLNKAYIKKTSNKVGSHYYSTKPKKNEVDSGVQEFLNARKVEVLLQEWAERNIKEDDKEYEIKLNDKRVEIKQLIEDTIKRKKEEMQRLKKLCKVKDNDDFDIQKQATMEVLETLKL